MKKNKIYTLLCGLLLLTACQEEDLNMFGDRHEVYFEKFFMDAYSPGTETADSTSASFFFAEEDDDHIMVDLVVCLAGRKLERDLKFSLEVEKDGTTALPEEYQIEPSYTFRASSYLTGEGSHSVKDTIRIRMNRSQRLDDFPQGIRLVVKLMPSSDVVVGQYERSKAIIILTKDAVKPLWWDEEVNYELLGTYSPKKYKLFLQNIEGAYELDEKMIAENPSKARQLAIDFKKWLDKNPQVEEDGSKMSVNV